MAGSARLAGRFPNSLCSGADRKQARRNVNVALERVITARIALGRSLPKPATEAQIKRHKGGKIELSLLAVQKCMLCAWQRGSPAWTAPSWRAGSAGLARRSTIFFALIRPRASIIEAAFAMLQRDAGGQVARRLRAGAAAWTGPAPTGDRRSSDEIHAVTRKDRRSAWRVKKWYAPCCQLCKPSFRFAIVGDSVERSTRRGRVQSGARGANDNAEAAQDRQDEARSHRRSASAARRWAAFAQHLRRRGDGADRCRL